MPVEVDKTEGTQVKAEQAPVESVMPQPENSSQLEDQKVNPQMIYQNQLMYARMYQNQMAQNQMAQNQMAQQQMGQQQMGQQQMGQHFHSQYHQAMSQHMRMPNGMRPGMYYYPVPMYNPQMVQQQMVQQQFVNPQFMNQQMVNWQMSKFMPQYNAYLSRTQADPKDVKNEPKPDAGGEPETSIDQANDQASVKRESDVSTGSGVTADEENANVDDGQAPTLPTQVANDEAGQGQQGQQGQQAQQTGQGQQGQPDMMGAYNPYGMRYGVPPFGYGVNPMMFYGQQPRLLVGNAIDGIPALRHASSQFQSVTQMLDALATQPRRRKRAPRNRETANDPEFKNVLQEYFSPESREESDDEFLLSRGVKDFESNGIRRSARARTKNSRYDEYAESDTEPLEEQERVERVRPAAKKRRAGGPVRRAPKETGNPYAKSNFITYDSESENSQDGSVALRRRRKVNYAEMEESWSDTSREEFEVPKETIGGIDRIINHRVAEDGEREYLVKWQGMAHIHNTWSRYDELQEYNGIKRLDNYIKRLEQMDERHRNMSVDEIEQESIASELQRQIDEDALEAERIVSFRTDEDGRPIYLVKWRSCPYDQCTEEEEEVLINHGFEKLIESFKAREDRICGDAARRMPWNNHSISLTKFEPYLETPEFLSGGTLRGYQLTGLNWMVNRMKRGLSVLLADEMGLGKTVQTISLVGHFMYKEGLIGPYLVIVPQSTIDNWMREFERWLPQANAICYYGNATAREMIRSKEICKVFVPGKGERYKCDVCITTPSIINATTDLDFLRRISWQLMVVDEAHQLKNRNSKRFVELMQFMADYKLLLSGTPLHNNLEELWTLLHFINPQVYTYYEDFRRRYSDVENSSAIGENKQRQLAQLQQELHQIVLRRVKKDVEKNLPNKVERILRVELSPMQVEWYKNILTRNYDQLAKSSGGSKSSLQNICMELKKVCNHPFLCYEPEDRQQWLQGLVYGSGKICLLEKLLQRLKERGNRVLIFSQMVRMLNIISDYLTIRGFKHQRLDGTMGKEVRKKAMDHFNDPNSDDFCFLLSTKAGGLGINLTSADTVIIYDSDWNPQNDLQAEARAHRIGQTKTVQIYRLVTKDSIEQTILERAKTKMVLDALVVQGLNKRSDATIFHEDPQRGGFSREELAKILKFGASKLWASNTSVINDGGDKSIEIDLDKVLEEAEVTSGKEGLAADLLSSYTNITEFRYEPPEEDVVDGNKEFWEATIPLEERVKLKKEELQVLGPRRSRARENISTEANEYSEDDEADGDFQPRRKTRLYGQIQGKRTSQKKKVTLTVKDKIKIYRSLGKFGVPELRLKDIHADTKLHKVDARVILNECQNIIDMCKCKLSSRGTNEEGKEMVTTTLSSTRSKTAKAENLIELGDVKINPSDFLEKLHLLECLEEWGRSQAGPNWSKSDNLQIPDRVLNHMNEGKEEWTNEDCINLLKLVYIYGLGYWTLMCADKELCVGLHKGMKHDRAKARTNKLLQTLAAHVNAPDAQDEEDIETLIKKGRLVKKKQWVKAVKWVLKDSREDLRRLKDVRGTDQMSEEMKTILPTLKKCVADAIQEASPTVATRLHTACWRFITKLLGLESIDGIEMQDAPQEPIEEEHTEEEVIEEGELD